MVNKVPRDLAPRDLLSTSSLIMLFLIRTGSCACQLLSFLKHQPSLYADLCAYCSLPSISLFLHRSLYHFSFLHILVKFSIIFPGSFYLKITLLYFVLPLWLLYLILYYLPAQHILPAKYNLHEGRNFYSLFYALQNLDLVLDHGNAASPVCICNYKKTIIFIVPDSLFNSKDLGACGIRDQVPSRVEPGPWQISFI